MKTKIQAVRGMNDILPADSPYWQFIESAAREVLSTYGYREIRLPLLEKTELFQRSIGEVTDIVEKEMYTFLDRNDESLTLRPEATAGMVRAGIERGLLHNQVQRLWCAGPMFRYERPQKGRYRQFHQLDVEAFGLGGPDIDAELVLVLARLWRGLGLTGLGLQINSLGTKATQASYKARLVEYFRARESELDEDSVRRLGTNPLRILDSKNPHLRALIDAAPRMVDHLDEESGRHFEDLQSILEGASLPFEVNPHLVRGLDYYTRTVFEWTTPALGAQDAVCGGGRYDGLVADIGGQPTPGIGFAVGIERIVELLKTQDIAPPDASPDVYLAAVGALATLRAHPLAERIRDHAPELRLLVDAAEGSFGKKLRNADRSGAAIALVLGDREAAEGTVGIKFLRGCTPQETVSATDPGALARRLASACGAELGPG